MIRKYGYKVSRLDHRDHKLTASRPMEVFPDTLDLRPEMPEVYDQLNLGACVSNSWGGMFEWLQIKEKRWVFTGSRLFNYYQERVLDGSPLDQDTGSELRTGAKVLAQFGAPHERIWPYDVSKFAVKPPPEVYTAGTHHMLHRYMTLDNTNLSALMLCLLDGFPFVFGFSVFDALESDQVAKDGMLPMPGAKDKPIGGHAVMCVGYIHINNELWFIVRNSWGKDWAIQGYFMMPAKYMTNASLVSDVWTCRPI